MMTSFVQWLEARRPLGLTISNNTFSVADATGTNWSLDFREDAGQFQTAVDELLTSGRRAWAFNGTEQAGRLSALTGRPLADFDRIVDIGTAFNVARPGVPVPVDEKSTSYRLADLVAELQTVDRVTVSAVLDSVQHDLYWRPRQIAGWGTDMDFLAAEERKAARAKRRSIDEVGTDLITAYSEADKTRIHGWLAETGITITDRHGQPTLNRDDLDEGSHVPSTDEARAAWEVFRRARSVASRGGKLAELRRAVRKDRVYSRLYVRGAKTGRMISRKPALQNLHRDLRPVLCADEGYVLVALDLHQAEPRIMAGLSQDPVLIAAALGDVYSDLAIRLWGGPLGWVPTKELRDRAKTLLLAIFYGKGRGGLARDLGITVDEAGNLLRQTLGQYPELAAYNERLKADMRARLPLPTASGRPVPRPSRGEYQILNNRIQSEAADFFYSGVARVVQEMGSSESLWLGMHDEVVLHVPEADAERARLVLETEMPADFHGVRIDGVAEILGSSWRKTE